MPLPKNDALNKEFSLAADYIMQTNKSLFLTGKAGTGKTTFLKYIRQHSAKNMMVVAPTGVAAINAGGVTIHSFLQLPLSPFILENLPGKGSQHDTTNRHSLIARLRFNRDKKQLIQQLELLIIDEISMVRCDIMDAIDTVLKYFRANALPFGGVQILFIGDMYQLPPVTADNEWNILSQFYESPYFFSSKVMQLQQYAYVELKKIYRQRDNNFIHVLNQVRNNELDEYGYNLLHNRYQPVFQPAKEERYIILTTHNYKADAINNNELNNLKGNMFTFRAFIKGEFYEKSFPADEALQLKVGAQVMFIKNDSEKRFYNGKIGSVNKILDDIITIECEDRQLIDVKKDVWRNIRYTLNNQTKKIEEEEVGSFTQFPLRLAWAITIHKSQGLTFEKAVIDAGASFAPGQVYVALSRCTNLQGMVLHSRINNSSIQTDKRIAEFTQQLLQAKQHDDLLQARHEHQQKIILQTFCFSDELQQLKEAIKVVEEHASSFSTSALSWLQQLLQQLHAIDVTALNFQSQIKKLLQPDILPEDDKILQQRLTAAADYFVPLLHDAAQKINQHSVVTDSRQHALSFNDEMKLLYDLLQQKINMVQSMQQHFAVSKWYESKTGRALQRFTANSYSGIVVQPV